MTAAVSECVRILCRALGVDALPARQVARVEQWSELPGFTVDRFRKIVLDVKQRGGAVHSVAYFEPLVAEVFRPIEPPVSAARRPRLLAERSWPEYYQYRTAQYGAPDAQTVMDLWFRYNGERMVLGLPIEEEYETRDPLSLVRGAAPDTDPIAVAPGG